MKKRQRRYIMERKWIVYMYRFPNGKKYIGATCRTLATRQGKDWSKYKSFEALWDAIQTFGVKSIEQTILFEGVVSGDEAKALERMYIAQHDTTNPQKGYNVGPGGEGLSDRVLSEARKEALREQMAEQGRKNRGRVVSDETREKQRRAKLGKTRGPMNAETKAKISTSNSRENMSMETRMRRSKSKQKKVLAVNVQTGEQLVFNCEEAAAAHFGVQASAVSRWIKGTRKPNNNYTFSFFTNND